MNSSVRLADRTDQALGRPQMAESSRPRPRALPGASRCHSVEVVSLNLPGFSTVDFVANGLVRSDSCNQEHGQLYRDQQDCYRLRLSAQAHTHTPLIYQWRRVSAALNRTPYLENHGRFYSVGRLYMYIYI